MTNLAQYLNRPCAADHFGAWMIEPRWFKQAVGAIESGLWTPQAAHGPSTPKESGVTVVHHGEDAEGRARPLYTFDGTGRAIIQIDGMMTKGESSFGGTSMIRTRLALRHAVANEAVRGIMLSIDSPGGTAAGTPQLADEVRRVAGFAMIGGKPIHAHAEDTIASAAYFVGSQAQRLTATAYAGIGSIGTVVIVDDTSGMNAQQGIKTHVIATGPFKGAFADGSQVTGPHLEYARETVDRLTEPFIDAIARGRSMLRANARRLAYGDEGGKVWGAARARELGLVDGTATFDHAMTDLLQSINARERQKEDPSRARSRRRRIAMLELGN